jgi:hypothetical protein
LAPRPPQRAGLSDSLDPAPEPSPRGPNGTGIPASLPDTVDELIEQLEDPRDEIDIEAWANALGATGQCAICSAVIIDAYSFGEAVIDHYQLTDPEATQVQERIEGAIYGSGAETGGSENSSLCSYHDDLVTKDN